MNSRRNPLPTTNEEWKQVLSDQQFFVARQRGTEKAFTGDFWDSTESGTYQCVCCWTPIFYSTQKFRSGTGYASFSGVVSKSNVEFSLTDTEKNEVECAVCHAYLGRIYRDGPKPDCLRFSINSAALRFVNQRPPFFLNENRDSQQVEGQQNVPNESDRDL